MDLRSFVSLYFVDGLLDDGLTDEKLSLYGVDGHQTLQFRQDSRFDVFGLRS